ELKPGAHRLRDCAREAADPARDPEREQYETDYYSCGGDLARPQTTRQDYSRDGFHRLYRQWQPVIDACPDQENGEAEKHSGWGKTGDGYRAEEVRDEGSEIAARAATFQEEAASARGLGGRSHKLQIPETAAADLPYRILRRFSSCERRRRGFSY